MYLGKYIFNIVLYLDFVPVAYVLIMTEKFY